MEDYFDWKYYVSKYKDLQNANINTYDKALKHWKMFGMREGRICNQNILTVKKKIIKPKKSIPKEDKKIVKVDEIIEYTDLLDYVNKDDLEKYHIDAKNTVSMNGQPKIIAVIPVHGREILLKYTIRRLYNKNNLYKVICVGSTELEKEVVLKENAIWVNHDNKPLGKKWNTGFRIAQIYNPDAILFVGSSDWISSDWIPNAYKHLEDNVGIVGKNRFDMIDSGNNIKTCYWLGYPENTERFKETIGIGRLISRKFLDSINFEPFDNNLNNSMDYSMYTKCMNNKFTIKIIDTFGFFISISCNRWFNKHTFLYHHLGALDNIKELENLGLTKDNIDIYMRSRCHTLKDLKYIYTEFNELNDFYYDLSIV